MDYGNLKVPENVTPEVQAILDSYANRNKEIEKAHRKNMGRIGAGALLEAASLHPILNIPYVGTGLGGAMFEAGNAIMEGKKAKDIAKDAGIGFAVGESVGAIPYVGKYASKTKAGQAVANKVAPTVESLLNTPIAKKVEDALTTDIKAFNPFKQTQTAYHGSPYDFAKFSNEAIGTGEGAQAHGMGHYAAKSKDVADRYREDLTNIKNDVWNVNEINYKGNKYTADDDTRKFLYLKDIAYGKYNKKDQLKILENSRKDYLQMNSPKSVINQIDDEINFVKNIDAKEFDDINKGQLYKLSIPKDDVMLREDLPFSQQPIKVQEALNKIGQYEIKNPAIMYNGELYRHEPKGLFKGWYSEKSGEKASDELSNILNGLGYTDEIIKRGSHFDNSMTGGQIYNKLNNDYHNNYHYTQGLKPSDLLNQHGIKGISYNGGIDGEARVIFNPDDIDIVRKYYNQPSLGEMLLKKSPNAGATSNYLYDLMIRE